MADPGNFEQAVEIGLKKAGQIFARRVDARATRAAALAAHPQTKTLSVSIASPATPSAAPTVSTIQTAGYLAAAGDSWFDYPVHDVLTKLEDNYGYNVESSAHAGDAIESMAYSGGQLDDGSGGQLDKFARCLDKILEKGVAPKAVLVSGGGDDIAGKEFGMLINNATSPIAGWNAAVVDAVINQRIATAYRIALSTITNLCQTMAKKTVPILVHGYDYPVPDGRGFLGGWLFLPGPWLKPGFEEKLFENLTVNTAMMVNVIDTFNTMLAAIPNDPGFAHVHYVNLRGTLSNVLAADAYQQSWANELHPTDDGFTAVASKFAAELATLP